MYVRRQIQSSINEIISFLTSAQQNQNIELPSQSSTIKLDVWQTFNIQACKLQTMQQYVMEQVLAFKVPSKQLMKKIRLQVTFINITGIQDFFYTECIGAVRKNAIFIENENRFDFCGLDKQQQIMIDITDFFNINSFFGKLQESMQPSQIGETWIKQQQTFWYERLLQILYQNIEDLQFVMNKLFRKKYKISRISLLHLFILQIFYLEQSFKLKTNLFLILFFFFLFYINLIPQFECFTKIFMYIPV
ncbi:unnamed protein product [Paramecium primaurelia]|uniref:Transmembrane protein n=1 Tax=Paramecium primaurelia TaxID=5886 RepID=A0A8S1PN77_PARPR|nr:unnamed protein product [Paramecium primaurelia]